MASSIRLNSKFNGSRTLTAQYAPPRTSAPFANDTFQPKPPLPPSHLCFAHRCAIALHFSDQEVVDAPLCLPDRVGLHRAPGFGSTATGCRSHACAMVQQPATA